MKKASASSMFSIYRASVNPPKAFLENKNEGRMHPCWLGILEAAISASGRVPGSESLYLAQTKQATIRVTVMSQLSHYAHIATKLTKIILPPSNSSHE